MVRDGILTAGQVRPLIGIDNAEELATRIAERGLNARVRPRPWRQKAKQPSASRKQTAADSDLTELSEGIARRLGVKVKISPAKNGAGKVVLQYANLADLDKIIDILQQKSTVRRQTGQIYNEYCRLRKKNDYT